MPWKISNRWRRWRKRRARGWIGLFSWRLGAVDARRPCGVGEGVGEGTDSPFGAVEGPRNLRCERVQLCGGQGPKPPQRHFRKWLRVERGLNVGRNEGKPLGGG